MHCSNGKNTLKCLNIGTPKTINFPFGTNGKLILLGVPILQHFSIQILFLDSLVGAVHTGKSVLKPRKLSVYDKWQKNIKA